MAEITWKEEPKRSGLVKLTGRVRLKCTHVLTEYATVRDRPAAVEQGKETIQRMLSSKTMAHVQECSK